MFDIKKVFLKISQNKKSCNSIRMENLAQVLSYEFCYMYNNTFFTKKLRITASKINYLFKRQPHKMLKQFVGKFPTNCLSVFDDFMGLTIVLSSILQQFLQNTENQKNKAEHG